MDPFSPNTLTIMALVSISSSGVLFIILIIASIFFIYKSCTKRRVTTSVEPIRTQSPIGSTSIDRDSLPTSPFVPRSNPVTKHDPRHRVEQLPKPPKQSHYLHDTLDVITERSNTPYYSNHKKSQQQRYMRDESDDTTTIEDYRFHNPSYPKRTNEPYKPVVERSAFNRETPYPPDVLVRDEIMKKNRF